jgi:hypothetical protein
MGRKGEIRRAKAPVGLVEVQTCQWEKRRRTGAVQNLADFHSAVSSRASVVECVRPCAAFGWGGEQGAGSEARSGSNPPMGKAPQNRRSPRRWRECQGPVDGYACREVFILGFRGLRLF